MNRLCNRLLLAATIGLLLVRPAVAEPSARLENSLTAGGLNIAPRYLDQVGDIDLNLLGGYLTYPSMQGGLGGGQFALQARIHDRLQVLANMGAQTEIGLRGPLTELSGARLGWDLGYRSDLYFLVPSGTGLSTPFGLATYPGTAAHGVAAKLEAMYPLLGFDLFAAPVAAMMSNRTILGVDAGIDWSLGRLGVGYGLSFGANVYTPAQSESVVGSELQHSVGVRYNLDDRLYAQGNYYYKPSDTYGLPYQAALAGVGMRLLGSTPKAPVPEPTPVPTPMPTPVPTPAPVVSEVPLSVQGTFYHSLLPNNLVGKRLAVALKKEGANGFVDHPATTRTDERGRFEFRGLPKGRYQVVFRDQGLLPNTAGALVSEPVTVPSESVPTVELDLAWDESAFGETLVGDTETFTWSLKPHADDVVYQGNVARDDENIIPFPEVAVTDTKATLALSAELKRSKPRYIIKFWKKGGSFKGGNYYGQSRPRSLKLNP